jgi:hypothetical protein
MARARAPIADRITLSSGLRCPLASITAQVAKDYLPFASGIGTFVPIYQRYEGLEYLQESGVVARRGTGSVQQ